MAISFRRGRWLSGVEIYPQTTNAELTSMRQVCERKGKV